MVAVAHRSKPCLIEIYKYFKSGYVILELDWCSGYHVPFTATFRSKLLNNLSTGKVLSSILGSSFAFAHPVILPGMRDGFLFLVERDSRSIKTCTCTRYGEHTF